MPTALCMSPFRVADDSNLTFQPDTSASRTEFDDSPYSLQPSEPNKRKSGLIFTLLAALAIAISYADRSNLSTAIIPMAAELHWDTAFSGIILSAFWAGYALTQVLGGSLADRFGGEKLLPFSLFIWSLCTGITPFTAHLSTSLVLGGGILSTVPVLLNRVILGAGEGMALPSVQSMVKTYVNPKWRSLAVSTIIAACYLGSVMSNAVMPSLIQSRGWESSFFIFALLPSLIWLPLWYLFTSNNNSPTPQISPNNQQTSNGAINLSSFRSTTLPLLQSLLTKKPIWAIILAQYTQAWGMVGLLSWLPSFFSDRFHVPVEQLSMYTALPYVLQLGVSLVAGYIADLLINKYNFRTLRVRQVMQGVGMIAPAICLSACVLLSKSIDLPLASLLVSIGSALSALTVAGVSCNQLDLSLKHSGTIFALGNTASCLGGLLAVPIAGWLFQTTGSWDGVFTLFAAHYAIGAVLYTALASDQPLQGLPTTELTAEL